MSKKVSFNKVKKVLIDLNKKNCRNLPKYQLEANEQFFNTILSNIENGKLPCWIWPNARTSFEKDGNMCVVTGALAKLF